MSRLFPLCAWMLAVVCGCASQPEHPQPQHPQPVQALSTDWITELGDWPEPELDLVQLVRFTDRHHDATHLLRFDVALSSERLLLSAQTTVGIPLYRLTLTRGELVTTRHPAALDQIPMESALADFLLAAWPLKELEVALEKSGYTIEAGGDQRRLKNQAGVVLIEIRGLPVGTGQPVQITHHDIPLDISVQTLERRAPSFPSGTGPGTGSGARVEDQRQP